MHKRREAMISYELDQEELALGRRNDVISRFPRQLSFVTISDSYISRVPTPLSAHGAEITGTSGVNWIG